MTLQDDVINEFEDASAILNGHFVLSSGLHSDTYLQCARVLMDPLRSMRLCEALLRKFKKEYHLYSEIDMVIAPAMGGIIVGYEIARQLELPSIFCERVDGRFTLRRGFSIPQDAKVLVVEDVITTGKSSLEAIQCIQSHGGIPVAEVSLVKRSQDVIDLGIPTFSLLELDIQSHTPDQLPEHLKTVPEEKPGSRFLKN